MMQNYAQIIDLNITIYSDFIREISRKGKKCSNLVFGGKKGKTIFVTLQDRKGMERFENDIVGKKH